MIFNGLRTRTDAELTEYQKKIETIDNVILCVSEAEHMIHSIGENLKAELPEIEKPAARRRKRERPPWADRRNLFKR